MEMLRESSVGHIVRFLSRDAILQYPDERAKFEQALQNATAGRPIQPTVTTEVRGEIEDVESASSIHSEKTQSAPPLHTRTSEEVVLVGWYSLDDAENPQNWSNLKRYSAGLLICLYTLSVYLGSTIYTPGLQGVVKEFGVGQTVGSLDMALYVLAYGMGPILFSPLSEIPSIGRTIPYIITFNIFTILLIPTSLVQNFPGLMVLRFLLGFLGSPCLATAGASFQDIFPASKVPYIVATWAAVAALGPSCGPVAGGFSVPIYGWRWTEWELLWLAGPLLIGMNISLPETSASTILLRRAKRLRKITGDQNIMSQSEIDEKNLSVKAIAFNALVKPWEINALDPAILFTTFFTGLVYGLLYTYFEVFPIVYGEIYRFKGGELGLTYLANLVGVGICIPIYMAYYRFVVERKTAREGEAPPENFLIAGIWSCWILPAGLFLLAFTGREDIHWIVVLIGVVIATASIYITTQCIFLYVPFCYPQFAVSLLAANALSRSIFACAAILYAPYMFQAMGVRGGVSFLAGLTVLCCGGLWFLYFFGARLRARSRFATK